MVKPRQIKLFARYAPAGAWVAAALSAGDAAAAPRFTKKEEAVIATQTELTKPKDPTKKREDKKKPDLTASDVFAGMGEGIAMNTPGISCPGFVPANHRLVLISHRVRVGSATRSPDTARLERATTPPD